MVESRDRDPIVRTRLPVPVTSLAYRPRSYFGGDDPETTLLTRVKGRMRRAAIRHALERGELDLLPPTFLSSELEAPDRAALGALHPAFMGGEYLPRPQPGDVEIARISIDSTTNDVVAVYARRVGGRIAYRVADEYGGETLGGRTTCTSMRPLTMGGLIEFLLGAWDLFSCLEANFDDDLDGMLDFFRAESAFYPCLDAAIGARVVTRYRRHRDDEAVGEVSE